jgi:hypothetical protein
MWKLRGRDGKTNPWSELGDFRGIAEAAQRIREIEGDPQAALMFCVTVGPTPSPASAMDAEILSRLIYASEKHYYLLERVLQ